MQTQLTPFNGLAVLLNSVPFFRFHTHTRLFHTIVAVLWHFAWRFHDKVVEIAVEFHFTWSPCAYSLELQCILLEVRAFHEPLHGTPLTSMALVLSPFIGNLCAAS